MTTFTSARLSACRAFILAACFACAPDAEAALAGSAIKTTPKQAIAAEEMWLAVAVNGQVTGTTALVRYDHDRNLWVSAEELRSWRLPLPQNADTSVPGSTMYPLTGLEGLAFRVDEVSQTLTVDAPAHLFDSMQFGGEKKAPVTVPDSPPGGLLNYDLFAVHGAQGLATNGLLEAGAFGRFGTAVTRFLGRKSDERAQSVRLESTWTIDRPQSIASLRIGDSITGASRFWGGAARFAGVQWASNFATQPGLVTMPLPSVAGESALPSTLELYVNNALRMRETLPGGPFTVNEVPVVSGDGQIRVVVRDMLGREQVITQSYYASSRLLKKGLSDFSFEAGAVRENFGIASNDYGRPLMVATHRHGLTDSFTGEVHAELLEDQQTAGVSGAMLIPRFGSLSLGLAASLDDIGMGHLITAGFERAAAQFSFGVSAELASEAFTRVGVNPRTGVPRLKAQAFASVSLGRAGSVSMIGTRQALHDGSLTSLVGIRHNMNVPGVGHLGLSALRVVSSGSAFGEDSEMRISLNLSRPLGGSHHASMGVDSDAEGVSGNVQMQKGLPAGTGLGYRAQARTGLLQAASGSVSYQNDVGTYTLEAQQSGNEVQTSASVSGGIAMMAGLYPSRRIDGSFAVARVGDFGDVRVYRDNQLIGRTNDEGYVMLPGLRAYEDNQISIEQADLPLDLAVGALQVKAMPAYRSGILLTFPIERVRGALLTVLLENGEPLPAGALVMVPGQAEPAPVGMRGEVYIGQLADNNRLRASWGNQSCEFDVAYTPSDDPLPLLGPFECRAVR